MPTKDELERENAGLRDKLAVSQATMAALPICQRLCPCGLRFHLDPPCYAHIQGDMAVSCVCPDHPETAPPPKANVEEPPEGVNA